MRQFSVALIAAALGLGAAGAAHAAPATHVRCAAVVWCGLGRSYRQCWLRSTCAAGLTQ